MTRKIMTLDDTFSLGEIVWHKELGPVVYVGTTCVPNSGRVTLFRFHTWEHDVYYSPAKCFEKFGRQHG